MYYEKMHGYIKDVKFYFDNIVSENLRLCSTDGNCAECSESG